MDSIDIKLGCGLKNSNNSPSIVPPSQSLISCSSSQKQLIETALSQSTNSIYSRQDAEADIGMNGLLKKRPKCDDESCSPSPIENSMSTGNVAFSNTKPNKKVAAKKPTELSSSDLSDSVSDSDVNELLDESSSHEESSELGSIKHLIGFGKFSAMSLSDGKDKLSLSPSSSSNHAFDDKNSNNNISLNDSSIEETSFETYTQTDSSSSDDSKTLQKFLPQILSIRSSFSSSDDSIEDDYDFRNYIKPSKLDILKGNDVDKSLSALEKDIDVNRHDKQFQQLRLERQKVDRKMLDENKNNSREKSNLDTQQSNNQNNHANEIELKLISLRAQKLKLESLGIPVLPPAPAKLISDNVFNDRYANNITRQQLSDVENPSSDDETIFTSDEERVDDENELIFGSYEKESGSSVTINTDFDEGADSSNSEEEPSDRRSSKAVITLHNELDDKTTNLFENEMEANLDVDKSAQLVNSKSSTLETEYYRKQIILLKQQLRKECKFKDKLLKKLKERDETIAELRSKQNFNPIQNEKQQTLEQSEAASSIKSDFIDENCQDHPLFSFYHQGGGVDNLLVNNDTAEYSMEQLSLCNHEVFPPDTERLRAQFVHNVWRPWFSDCRTALSVVSSLRELFSLNSFIGGLPLLIPSNVDMMIHSTFKIAMELSKIIRDTPFFRIPMNRIITDEEASQYLTGYIASPVHAGGWKHGIIISSIHKSRLRSKNLNEFFYPSYNCEFSQDMVNDAFQFAFTSVVNVLLTSALHQDPKLNKKSSAQMNKNGSNLIEVPKSVTTNQQKITSNSKMSMDEEDDDFLLNLLQDNAESPATTNLNNDKQKIEEFDLGEDELLAELMDDMANMFPSISQPSNVPWKNSARPNIPSIDFDPASKIGSSVAFQNEIFYFFSKLSSLPKVAARLLRTFVSFNFPEPVLFWKDLRKKLKSNKDQSFPLEADDLEFCSWGFLSDIPRVLVFDSEAEAREYEIFLHSQLNVEFHCILKGYLDNIVIDDSFKRTFSEMSDFMDYSGQKRNHAQMATNHQSDAPSSKWRLTYVNKWKPEIGFDKKNSTRKCFVELNSQKAIEIGNSHLTLRVGHILNKVFVKEGKSLRGYSENGDGMVQKLQNPVWAKKGLEDELHYVSIRNDRLIINKLPLLSSEIEQII